jgi:hypothetical protein
VFLGKHVLICEICVSHSNVAEDSSCLGCVFLLFDENSSVSKDYNPFILKMKPCVVTLCNIWYCSPIAQHHISEYLNHRVLICVMPGENHQ